MTVRAEMTCDQGIIAESVEEDAVNDINRGVSALIGTMMGTCEVGDAG